jgi:methionyl aminopeptidase
MRWAGWGAKGTIGCGRRAHCQSSLAAPSRDFMGRWDNRRPMTISIKTAADVQGMRIAGRLASEVLDMLTGHVKPGITTEQLDQLAHDHIVKLQGGIPAPLNYAPPGYTPYPKSICTSVNDQVCHGIPNERVLKNGDIVNIDVTVIKDGWHGDTSRMYIVGEGSIAARRLCNLTYEAMWKGITRVRPGVRLGDIGHTIQTFAENQGFTIVREFCGHGIGRQFHEQPQVLHYGRPGTLEELLPGMVFTIEPMVNAGRRDIKEDRRGGHYDGWTIVTKDRSLSAQWEHTVLVTDTGYEVLTVSEGTPPPPAFAVATASASASA